MIEYRLTGLEKFPLKETIVDELIISVSGLRGIVGQSLTPDVTARFARAFAIDLAPGPILLSRDGRASGPMLAEAIQNAICGLGRTVINADIAATPTAGVLVREHKAAGGIQITASHNPSQYNGMKLFGADGRVLPAKLGEKVLRRYQAAEQEPTTTEKPGEVQTCQDNLSGHLALILGTVDVERIRKQAFHVLLDSNRGAGSPFGKKLLSELGCQVTLLGGEPDGQFEHTPEPTAENLSDVCGQVTAAGAVIGFCQDPDADRLAVIDENGRYLGEEYTLALCLDHVLRQHRGAVVANCATSLMSRDVTEKHGSTFFRSAVGEANVVDLMLEQKAVFGGEGNGGPIDPRIGYIRDSFVGMALLLDALAARGLPISELADELPRYEIYKTKVTLDREKIPAALDVLEKHFADATADRSDGLRLDWPGRWLLVRASNTEPIVRLIAEGKVLGDVEGLCEEARGVLARVSM